MARTIDRLAAHWLKTRGERKSHTVTLADGPLTVWWSPWHLGQQDAVYHDYTAGEVFRPERFARIVMVKAEAEDGSRLFADIEKVELMTMVDPAILKELAVKMLADLNADNKVAAGEGPKAAAAGQTTTA